MRRAGEAGIIGPDRHLDVVQHAFGDLGLAGKVLHSHVLDRAVHAFVVVGRGHDQVAVGHLIMLIDLVVVDQIAARRLDHADALKAALAFGHQIGALQFRIMQEFADLFDAMHHLDHPCPVIGERRVVHPARECAQRAMRGICQRRVDKACGIHPGQGTDAVPAVVRTEVADIGELHV